jgi:uncharacterized peroxidase-related enzyme
MRLRAVERKHRLREKLILGLVRLMSGEVPDIMRTLFHRPEFFGRPLGAITNHAMRAPGEWSIAERELFAAYVSQRNHCAFCIVCHSEYAAQAGDRAEVEQILCEGPGNDARLSAAFEFLAAFAASPEAIGRKHIDALRTAGVRDEAIRDLAQIAFSFCFINRVAHALAFRVPPAADFARSWPAMGKRAYRV